VRRSASSPYAETVTHSSPNPPLYRTRLALVALVVFWGANFSLVKLALRDVSPLAFTTLRFLLASGVLWVFLKVGGDRLRVERSDWPVLIGLGLVGTTAYQSLFIYGISWTLAGNASLMLATAPIFTALLARMFRQERGGPRAWAGVGLSVLGIVLVVLGGAGDVRIGAGTLTGDLAVLAAAAAWSAYTVGSVPLVHRYGPVPVTAATMWAGTLGLLIVSLPALRGQNWTGIRPIAWLAVLYSGAFAIATAYFLWYYCVRQIGTTRTAVYTNLTPVVALLIAWPTLGEIPTLLQAVGAGGVIAGSLLVRAGKIERQHSDR
jgi:drug/metabolite transporter (DMT)-like permease